MPTPDLTASQVDALVETRDPRTGLRYPPAGLQPYHPWLIDALHRLAACSASDLWVALDDASPASIRVAPGRASIDGVAVAYAGGVHDLAVHNNATACVWLTAPGGTPTVSHADAATGWPAGTHLKLAEVTLAGGQVVGILDRRFETILAV
jgi:hypothetical protein